MIEFSIHDKDYRIDKMKVKHYYIVQDLQFLDNADSKISFVAALAECPEEELRTLSKSEFLSLWSALYEKFFQRKRSNTLMRTLHLNGVDYGLAHLDELTIGEFADLDVLHNDPMKEKKLHQIMAILYRPLEGWTKGAAVYTVEPYDAKACQSRANEFLEMDIEIVTGVITFFLSITKHSLNRIVDSLETQTQIPEERTLIADVRWTLNQLLEDGIDSSSFFQEKMLSSLIALQNSVSGHLLITPRMLKTNEDKKGSSKIKNWLRLGTNFKRNTLTT
jgi:hypothetical protein